MDKNRETKIKDIEKHLDKTLIFKNDADFLYLYKKTEKIASAVYLITNFFPASEPLRWTLRESVLDVLKDILKLSNLSSTQSEIIVREMQAGIFKTVSLFEIGYRAGFISHMNFAVLKDEFYSLISVLQARDKSQTQVEAVTLDPSFFYVERPQAVPQIQHVTPRVEKPKVEVKPEPKVEERSVLYKGHAKGHDVLKKIEQMHSQYIAQSQIPTHLSAPVATTSSLTSVHTSMPAQFANDKSDERQQTILTYLKEHQEISIKDLTRVIQGCSEKTIQRDLGNLINQGLIKKVGERRWSKYYLV